MKNWKKVSHLFSFLCTLLLCFSMCTTTSAAEYTITDSNTILYSNSSTVLYADADLASTVIMTADIFPDNIPVVVTGITSNGFYQVDLGDDVSYYIPSTELQTTTITSQSTVSPDTVSSTVTSNSTKSSYTDTKMQNDNSTSTMVWLSATGSKYHSINNCGRMNPDKARQVTESQAISSGYAKCSKCW